MSNLANTIQTQSDAMMIATLTNEDGTPMDLTGSTLIFTMKKKVTDPDSEAIIQKRITEFVDEDENPSATQGVAVFWLTHEETDICPATYFYDIKLIDSEGKGSPTETGTLTFVQSNTRSFS